MVRSSAWTLLFAMAPAAQDAALVEALATAVDLPTPVARRAAADQLAARKDVTLAQWLAAMRSFGVFRKSTPGVADHSVALWVGKDQTETTQLSVFVPRSYAPEKAAPLLVMFHGSGGSGAHQHGMWRAAAEALGMVVVSPTEAGANEGYAYSDRERNAARSAVRWARRQFHVDEGRIFGAGISRGGHLVWDLALRHPDLFAAIAPMIGGPRAVGHNNMRYLGHLTELPIRQLQGAKDDPQLVWNLREAFARLQTLGARDAKMIEFPELGHEFELSAVEWLQFLGAARQDPAPRKVVRLAARPGEGRAFWAEVTATTSGVAEQFQPQVKASEWRKIEQDEIAKRRFFLKEAEQRTARLSVTRGQPGRFVAAGQGVAGFRLLIESEWLDPRGGVVVDWNGKSTTHKITPSARVLLREFVERFDRRFLPTAEVEIR